MLKLVQAVDINSPFLVQFFAYLLLLCVQIEHRIVSIFLQLGDSLPAVFLSGLCKKNSQHVTYAIDG